VAAPHALIPRRCLSEFDAVAGAVQQAHHQREILAELAGDQEFSLTNSFPM